METQLSDSKTLKSENTTLRNQVESLQNDIAYLKEQVEWFRRQLFASRSEKIISPNDEQLEFTGFEELEAPEDKHRTVAAHERRIRKKKGSDKLQIPKDLPLERHFLDVSEEEKVCSVTGKALVKIGEEVSRKLAHRPGSFYVKEIIRPKYAQPQEADGGIVCAELPDSLLPRCQADESLLAELCVQKFADHNPLYRLEEIFQRQHIKVSRQLLSQWVLGSALALEPLYKEMHRAIVDSGNVFIDESPVSLLAPGKGKTETAYMWVIAGGKSNNPPLRVYHFETNRKHIHAERLLKDFSGVFHSDKYGAYEKLAAEEAKIWCPCWAHIRRKFVEAQTADPKLRRWVLRKIGYLFMLERVAWARSETERLRIRQEKEIPIINEIIQRCKDRLIHGKLLPKSKFKEALGYLVSLTPYLKNYTQHAYARLDNNVAERAIRPLVIGRKNWLFVGSDRGGKAAAILLSLIQTCRGLGINPRTYLEDVMRRIMTHPVNQLRQLLPDQWALD